MARWEPNAEGRLREAAFELFEARGFDQTTVAEIASRAGLTERTFFRYFADKREVLFSGAERLTARLADGVEAAPPSACALDAVEAGLRALDGAFGRDRAAQRQAVIEANPELRERELVKLATLTAGLEAALCRRGVDAAEASLAAQTGIAVFHVTFQRWLADPAGGSWSEQARAALAQLRALAAAPAAGRAGG